MRGLLAGKEALKAFYARYSAFVNAFLRFITAFAAVFLINQNIGLMPKLSGGLVPLFAGIICAFLPFGAIAFLIGIFLLAQLFAASMEVALITLVFLLIVVLLYYGFQPGDSAYLIVTPLLFFLKMPFAVPMILGLTGSLVSVIPMSCGIFLYYVILYVKQNGSFLAGSEQTEITQMLAQVVKNLLANPAMLVMIAACCLGALTVCVIKKLSINYSWGIAIGAGLILQILVVFIGDFRFGVPVSVPELVVGMIGAVIASLIYQLFVFSVDYSRTEYTQFEDDDYYYYVKAVPKIAISRTDVKVQEINKVKRR
ncbi:ABC transporter permease [Clostridium sp. AF35-15]|jgi:hypothetical protein|uniref:ABC transporter permease n=3 Tax=Clostridiaceae TaxID=31979 RepID=UPI000E484671|nr:MULTISPECIES: ABC transporter permease [Clostridium]RHP16887.1 ABC transporter permease [Clostridium sp. AF35-15]RHV31676.1 ABC transporter permease [Clostridium sp. OM04-7]